MFNPIMKNSCKVTHPQAIQNKDLDSHSEGTHSSDVMLNVSKSVLMKK